MKTGVLLTLNKDFGCRTEDRKVTLERGEQIMIEKIDHEHNKVLINLNAETSVWVGVETIKNITQEAA